MRVNLKSKKVRILLIAAAVIILTVFMILPLVCNISADDISMVRRGDTFYIKGENAFGENIGTAVTVNAEPADNGMYRFCIEIDADEGFFHSIKDLKLSAELIPADKAEMCRLNYEDTTTKQFIDIFSLPIKISEKTNTKDLVWSSGGKYKIVDVKFDGAKIEGFIQPDSSLSASYIPKSVRFYLGFIVDGRFTNTNIFSIDRVFQAELPDMKNQ